MTLRFNLSPLQVLNKPNGVIRSGDSSH